MKYLYPTAHLIEHLSPSLLSLKIARHSSCSLCSCSGLNPPPGIQVVPDDQPSESSLGDLGQYGSDEEENPMYLSSCACSHSVGEHGANEHEIGSEEFRRRSLVAIRLDELLQDVGKLLDFEYTDADIASLRQRMKLPVSIVALSPEQRFKSPPLSSPTSSILSDVPPPKRRRVSFSSLSGEEDDDDDDDEEDRPLAARLADSNAAQKTSGKRTAAARLPTKTAPSANGRSNGLSEHKVKVEEKMDENQLARLATGVPVDSAESNPVTVKTEKAATVELRKGIIRVTAVENDRQPRSLVILTGLKTLFQKQLPKMPREYIARLVYDSNSKALAIIKRGYKVVGGICFRPFPHRGFAEIVFFATASVDQVKGYGGMLMDHFKAHIRKAYPGMDHFLTYADNYAVGYFEKQGFSKEITLDRSKWAGYIKDYEGGTIMQCTMLPRVDYLDKVNITTLQQEAILKKIRQMSRSHIVHPGLPQFQEGQPRDVIVDPKDVPGLRESGWSPSMAENLMRTTPKSPDRLFMERLMRELKNHNQAWPFLLPVSAEEVPDYHTVIEKPMDFSTMENKLDNNQYSTLETFINDAKLVFDNCRAYNQEGSIYHKCSNGVEKFLKEQLKERERRDG